MSWVNSLFGEQIELAQVRLLSDEALREVEGQEIHIALMDPYTANKTREMAVALDDFRAIPSRAKDDLLLERLDTSNDLVMVALVRLLRILLL